MNKKLQFGKTNWLKMSQLRYQELTAKQKKLLMIGGCVVGIALLWPRQDFVLDKRIPVAIDLSHLTAPAADPLPQSLTMNAGPSFDQIVENGDTLSKLFAEAGVGQQTMYKVLEADLNVLVLDTLMPGNRIEFWVNDQGQLNKLKLRFSAAKQAIFTRASDGSYDVKIQEIKGIWQQHVVTGDIHGSFYLSAEKAGLSAAQIQHIESLLKEKINFSRDLRAGDKFSVVLSKQYVEGEATGESHILGIEIASGKQVYSAYRFTDGNFYDEHGHSLTRAFQRLPLAHMYRISSKFNPHRLHPVTGKIAPHNGVDFAVPIGTQVLATGDGIVSLVVPHHKYAGTYVVINNGGKYRTRFLHLSKILVKKGQHVSRGQVIALSGNTGRTTGPHLHYEFLINGHPVNPMTAKIPMENGLNHAERTQFAQLVKSRKLMMSLS